MISLKKLERMPERLLVKKCAYLFHEFGRQLGEGEHLNREYALSILQLDRLASSVDERAQTLLEQAALHLHASAQDNQLIWIFDDLYYALLGSIGASPADWDLRDREGLDASARTILPLTVYLDRIRSPFNVGSVFRTADSFGVERIILAEGTASPEHPRAKRTARGCEQSVRWHWVQDSALPAQFPEPVFALELGGTPIEEFTFPASGTVILGSEELGVSPQAAEIARGSLGFVTIPLAGTKGSLNVSVAFGILMQHWYQAVAASV
jgi:TrmH family RNA methyltransferase